MSEETKTDAKEKDTSGKDGVALELMKFIATSTGYGKGNQSVGFAGKAAKTPEEQADALLELFEKCRDIIYKR